MARVTVEDCVLKVPNRFDLVAFAAQRARDICAGSPLTVERDRDKNPVVALREIAEGTVVIEELHEAVIVNLQKHVETEQPEEEGETFDLETIVPELAGVGEAPEASAASAGAEEGGEDDLDLESLARELASEADQFRDRDEA